MPAGGERRYELPGNCIITEGDRYERRICKAVTRRRCIDRSYITHLHIEILQLNNMGPIISSIVNLCPNEIENEQENHYERTFDEKWVAKGWFIDPIVGPLTCEDGSTITQPLSHFTMDQLLYLCDHLGLVFPSKVSKKEMEKLLYNVVEVLARDEYTDIEVIWQFEDNTQFVLDMLEDSGEPRPHGGPIKRVRRMRHKMILHNLVRMQEPFELELDTRSGQMKRGLTYHVCCMDEIVKVVDQMKTWSAKGFIHVVSINAHGGIFNGEYLLQMHDDLTRDGIEFIKHYDGLCEGCKMSNCRGFLYVRAIVDELESIGEPVILMLSICRVVANHSPIPSSLARPTVAIIYACQAGTQYLGEPVKDPFHHTVIQELVTTTVSIRETVAGLQNRALPTASMGGGMREMRSPIDVEIHPDFPDCS